MTERQWQCILSALRGFALVEIPVLIYALQQPVFDGKLLAIGLLGGAVDFMTKYQQTRPSGIAKLSAETDSALVTQERREMPPEEELH